MGGILWDLGTGSVVPMLRVLSGHHTIAQVVVGGVLGGVGGVGWEAFGLERRMTRIARLDG